MGKYKLRGKDEEIELFGVSNLLSI